MKILWVTSEATPYAKTGGLADVSGALPEALAKRGHQVTVFMPFYRQQMGKLNLKFDERLDLIGVPTGSSTGRASTTGTAGNTTTTPSGSRSSAAPPWRSPCSASSTRTSCT